MISAFFSKKRWLWPLFALPLLPLFWPEPAAKTDDFSAEKVNLALRKTADELYRKAGDDTSRIAAVEQTGEAIWRIRLEKKFDYDALPALLEASFERHEIRRDYAVAVRDCDSSTVVLGFHRLDFLEKLGKTDSASVPCGGRQMPDGCHFLEIAFSKTKTNWPSRRLLGAAFLLLALGVAAGFGLARRQKKALKPAGILDEKADWLAFGNSRLDADGLRLECGGAVEKLTFREAKLLRLFVENADQLLERETILQKVWADEGVLVTRSVDMFVSRLRKKLAADPSVRIVAAHGVGYRLEVEK